MKSSFDIKKILEKLSTREKVIALGGMAIVGCVAAYMLGVDPYLRKLQEIKDERQRLGEYLERCGYMVVESDSSAVDTGALSLDKQEGFWLGNISSLAKKSGLYITDLKSARPTQRDAQAGEKGSRRLPFRLQFEGSIDAVTRFFYYLENAMPELVIDDWRLGARTVHLKGSEARRPLEGNMTLSASPVEEEGKLSVAKLDKKVLKGRDIFRGKRLPTPVPSATPKPMGRMVVEKTVHAAWRLVGIFESAGGEYAVIVDTWSGREYRLKPDQMSGYEVNFGINDMVLRRDGEEQSWEIGTDMEYGEIELPWESSSKQVTVSSEEGQGAGSDQADKPEKPAKKRGKKRRRR